MSLTIKSTKVEALQIINLIGGNFEKSDVSGLPHPWIDWNKFLPQIFQEENKFISFLFQLNSTIRENRIQDPSSFSFSWKNLANLLKDIQKAQGVLSNLQVLHDLFQEQHDLQVKLEKLTVYNSQLSQISTDKIFQSKKDHLIRLEAELKRFLPEYGLQKDDFLTKQNQIAKLNEAKTANQAKFDDLKDKQRVIFRETNDLTKNIDELESQTQTYEEKLADLDQKKDAEDFQRIQQKLKPFQEQMAFAKAKKAQKMQESMKYKEEMKRFESEIQDIIKKIGNLHPKFEEVQKRFSEIDHKYQNYISQIESFQKELGSYLQSQETAKPSQNLNSKGSETAIPYSSPYQIQQELDAVNRRLHFIGQKFSQFLQSEDKSAIEHILNEKAAAISAKIQNLKQQKSAIDSGDEGFLRYIGFFQDLKEFQSIFNALLQPIGITLEFIIAIPTGAFDSLTIRSNFTQNNKPVNIEADSKRIDKAYFYLAFITSVYLTLNLSFIPIWCESIPNSITTKQTFQKAVKMLEEALSSNKAKENPHLVFFIKNIVYDELPTTLIQ